MPERRFHRVPFSTPADLLHDGVRYRGFIQNISLRGALVTSRDCIMIPIGDRCTLSVILDDGTPPLSITVRVVHAFYSMAGVSFASFAPGSEERLFELMKGITPQPEKLKKEWEDLLGRRGDRELA